MNMIDITPIVNAVIALLAAGVSVFLIPWIKSKTTDAQRKELLEWVKIGVAAAEQLYEGQGRGEEKKKYVLEFLASMGFIVDEEAVNAAIEAAVNQLNGGNLPAEGGPAGPPFILQRRHKDMSENKKPALNMRYYNGEIDDDLPYTGVLNYDEETGLIYDEDGDVVDEKTLDAMLDGDGKGDDEDE